MKIIVISAGIILAVIIGITCWSIQRYTSLYEHCISDGNPDYICYNYVRVK